MTRVGLGSLTSASLAMVLGLGRERERVCEEEEKRWWKSDGAQDFSLTCSLCECLYGFSLTIAVTNNIYIGIYVKSAALDS